MKTIQTLCPLLIAIGTLSSAGASEKIFQKREIRLEEAPESVQAGIREHMRNGKLDELEKVFLDGTTIYIAEVELGRGRDLDLYFRESGALIKSVEEISHAEMPEPVRRAAEEATARGGKVDDIDRVIADGVVTYRIEIDRRGPDLNLVISADGRILSETEDRD